jgi:hypothetical protein
LKLTIPGPAEEKISPFDMNITDNGITASESDIHEYSSSKILCHPYPSIDDDGGIRFNHGSL